MDRLRRKFSTRQSKGGVTARAVTGNSGSAGAAAQFAIKSVGSTLNVALQNNSSSNTVYAYITGRAIDNNNAIVLIQSDGRTPYYPSSPAGTQSPLQQDCAIPLGNSGSTKNVQIPRIAGGRIWFAIDGKLNFLLNPGPNLVEPSVTNPSDPSINVNWGFCEFTLNADQLYANISYVDFVSIPIAMTLTTANSGTQQVKGLPANGLTLVANALRSQNATDGAGWDRLIVSNPSNSSTPLRILSPNQVRVQNPGVLVNYFDSYINQVYSRLQNQALSVDTQSQFGIVSGQVSAASANSGNPILQIGGSAFPKPSTADIWTCSTGPFATGGNAETNAIIPRLSAAFNRSTLLSTNTTPSAASTYYQNPVTNHYSRILHSINIDGRGYAFPYDDVQATGAPDASGKVQAGDPVLWTISIGGGKTSQRCVIL